MLTIEFGINYYRKKSAHNVNIVPPFEYRETKEAILGDHFIASPAEIKNGKLVIDITNKEDYIFGQAEITLSSQILGELADLYHARAERAARQLVAAEELIDEIDNN